VKNVTVVNVVKLSDFSHLFSNHPSQSSVTAAKAKQLKIDTGIYTATSIC